KTSPGNADGSLLSQDEYTRQRMELLKEKARLEEMLSDASHRADDWLAFSERTFEFASTARSRFAEGDAATKKGILFAVGSNLTLKDKKLLIEARKPFVVLEESLSTNKGEIVPIEPDSISLAYESNEPNSSPHPRLLGELDYIRTLGHQYRSLVKQVYHFFR